MEMSFGSRRGGSCLLVLIILALVGVSIVAITRLAAAEKEREGEKRAAETKSVEKTPRQLQRERIGERLADKALDLGADPSNALVDGSIKTMRSVRDKTKRQQATIKSRLENAKDSVLRLRGERKQLEQKIAKLKDEFAAFPDDEKVGDELAKCDEDLESKRREILQAQADMKLLADYDYRMEREVATLSDAIRRCEASGRTIATASEYETLKKDLTAAHGASVEVGELRRNLDGKTMDVSAGVAGEKAKKRARLEKYRRKQSQE
ncbi:MAG: hypothetical protein ACI4Q3_08730 [Kiritimatiellia bacterium]